MLGLLLLILPRRLAPFPILATVSYMTMGQQLEVFGLNFTMMRLLLVIGWVRIVIRRELRELKFNTLDGFLVAWVTVTLIAYSLLRLTPDALINRLGFALNALGAYFLFRGLIRDSDDIRRVLQALAVVIVPLSAIMLNEWSTGRNAFSIFGGVSPITGIRDDSLRCQGPFGHPILAGVFGAVTLSWFVGLWHYRGGSRVLAVAGMAASTVIVFVSASSTPLFSYCAAILGLGFWPLRHRMRLLQVVLLALVVSLHILMKAPVWYLIARVRFLPSSTSYHRAVLVDRTIERVNEWWLLGTTSTAHWGHQMFDVANQYVRVAVDGGLLGLVWFLGGIVVGFATVGRAVRGPDDSRIPRAAAWALGAALFSHVVTFWGVSYWDQVGVMWFLQLAFLGSLRDLIQKPEPLSSLEPASLARGRSVEPQRFRSAAAGRRAPRPAKGYVLVRQYPRH